MILRATSQGEGVGKALVGHAIEELQALGCPKVNLQVRGNNADVATYCEDLGWTEDDNRSFGLLL